MKLYLAGPMRGYENFNFPAFDAAAKQLRGMGHEVFSPVEHTSMVHGAGVFQNNPNGDQGIPAEQHGFNFRNILKDDLSWICQEGDGIALLRGWEKSKGATAEHATAEALGLIILVQTEFGWRETVRRPRKKVA